MGCLSTSPGPPWVAADSEPFRVNPGRGFPRAKRGPFPSGDPTWDAPSLGESPIADLDGFSLCPGQKVECRASPVLLSANHLVEPDFDPFVEEAGYPGSSMIPAPSLSVNRDFRALLHYREPEGTRLEKDYVPRRSQSIPSLVVRTRRR